MVVDRTVRCINFDCTIWFDKGAHFPLTIELIALDDVAAYRIDVQMLTTLLCLEHTSTNPLIHIGHEKHLDLCMWKHNASDIPSIHHHATIETKHALALNKRTTHQAMDDIKDSIGELQHYREHFFRF